MEAVCKQRADAVEGGGGGGGEYHKKQQDDNEAHTRATADETEPETEPEPELPATYQSAQQPLKWQQQSKRRGGRQCTVRGSWAWALVGVHKLAGQTGKQAQLTSHKMTGCQ